ETPPGPSARVRADRPDGAASIARERGREKSPEGFSHSRTTWGSSASIRSREPAGPQTVTWPAAGSASAAQPSDARAAAARPAMDAVRRGAMGPNIPDDAQGWQ